MTSLIAKPITSVVVCCAVFASAVAAAAEKKDIVDTAVGAGSFKTLAAALGAADLVGALKGKGPFTVFAPTDDAFAKLPQGTVENLLKPENKDQLIAVLTYHVVSGEVAAKDVVKLKGAKTLNGQRVDIMVDGGKVSVDKANVAATDIFCTNGVIHVIDQVILPASKNIVETADNAGTFKTLLTAAQAAGLDEALAGKGPFTVFAPTDGAFAKLPKGTVAALLKDKEKLADILKYHVVAGRVYSEDALAAKKAATLQGSEITIGVSGGKAKVNDANLVATDIDASNGVIHVIDSVILPPAGDDSGAAKARDMIRHAVARGSRLYNAGHHSACADVYMKTMQQMMAYGDKMPEDVRVSVQKYMAMAKHTDCSATRSWTLRRGLDHAYVMMTELP